MKATSMTISSLSASSNILRRGLLFGTLAASLALAACGDKKPEGQVVAVVDGDEITSQEVNGTLGAAAAQGEPDQQVRNAALGQLVDRRLLAKAAREDGVENSPEYILRKRQMEENLLIQMMGEKLMRDNQKPSAQQINALITENPQAFADRTVFALDQIVFAAPARPDVLQALQPVKSMAEAVTVLNTRGIKFQRGNNTIDSANLPPQVFAQFKRVGSSEPLIIPAGGAVTVATIVDSKLTPVTGQAARELAQGAYAKREVAKIMKARVDAARKAAKIQYQSGFAAPAQPGAPAGAAPAAGAPAPAS